MKIACRCVLVLAFIAVFVQPTPATAGTITWVDWDTKTDSSVSGTLATMITKPPINVTFGGDVAPATQIADATGTDYWNPSTPYLSAGIDNAPPCCEIIATQTSGGVSFGGATLNPIIMAIFSLGDPGYGVTYTFNQPFTLLSGDSGTFVQTGNNTLTGFGGSGAIQFDLDVFHTIEWTTSPSPALDWQGFQIGIAQTIPDPAGTLLLFGAALGVLAIARRRAS